MVVAEVMGAQVDRAFARRTEPTRALGKDADGECPNVARALGTAHDAGMLTVALVGGDGGQIARIAGLDHVLIAHSEDSRVVKEVQVTTYHVLWELTQLALGST